MAKRRMDGDFCVVMENSWWTVNCVAGRTGNLPSQCRFLCFNGHGATSAGANEAIGGKRGPEAPVRRGASSGRDGEFRRQRTLRCRRGSVPSVTACFCRVPDTRRYFFLPILTPTLTWPTKQSMPAKQLSKLRMHSG